MRTLQFIAIVLCLSLRGCADDYPLDGPYRTDTASDSGFRTTYPTDAAGPRPVILWANGFGGTPPVYARLHRSLASYGCIVVAAWSPTTNSGTFDRALDHAAQLNARGDLAGRLDLSRVGLAGHSMGAGHAVNECLTGLGQSDPRIRAAVALSPWDGTDAFGFPLPGFPFDEPAQGPPLMALAGTVDAGFLSDAQFAAAVELLATTYGPAYFGGIVDGANHWEAIGDGGDHREPLIAWFLWHLTGDADAEQFIRDARSDSRWADLYEHY